MGERVGSALEVVGLSAVVAGVAMWSVPAALVVAGCAVFAIGFAA